MSVTKDATDLPVRRVVATYRIEIFLKKNGTINKVTAHRWLYTRQAGVDVVPPEFVYTIDVPVAQLTTAIVNQVANLDAIVDSLDTAPIVIPP